VPSASGAPGVNVAVLVVASYATVPATGAIAPCAVSVNDDDVIVAAAIGDENDAVTAAPSATPVAPATGLMAVTVGATPAPAEIARKPAPASAAKMTSQCFRPAPP
jgi:hypothetical protein